MLNVVCGIYEILNTINNKKYIGQSKDIHTRWTIHRYELRKNNHHNEYLQRAWNKYGENAFQFNILEICPQNMLDDRECYYIHLYNTVHRDCGYNLKPGGNGSNPSLEARKNMSEAQLARWTEEFRQEWSLKYTGENNPFYGKHHTEETGQKISEANRRRVWTEESRKKISESSKGRISPNFGKSTPQDVKDKISESLKGRPSTKKKAVVQLTKNGQYVETFDSLTKASSQTGVPINRISRCCLGHSDSAGGYLWLFQDEYDEKNNYVYKDKKLKPVIQLDFNGFFIAEHDSIKEAQNATGINATTIGACCNGRRKNAGSFIWVFKMNYIENIINSGKEHYYAVNRMDGCMDIPVQM